jgi:tRNA-uridine 2-sulfurtransferase
MARVLVAMSGGVDSSVAAALLVEQGHEVTGVHLKLADVPAAEQAPGHGCCTLDDAQDARRIAGLLGIPFYVWDLGDVFDREVQTPFAADYARGITPNPCVTCNERVKYAALLERAVASGFDALATGHHARLRRAGAPVEQPGGDVDLVRAADAAKDQTYVLWMASPWQLSHTLLPVGELTKAEVRRRADEFGFRVAAKPDSHDICFVPDGDTAGYLAKRLPRAPGPIVDLDGTVLGEHEGVWRFTVGQRRGLGLSGGGAAGSDDGRPRRRFVVDIDAVRSRVVVGPREALACHWAELADVSWTRGSAPTGPVRVQVRAHGATVPGCVVEDESRVRLDLEEPVYGLAPGQSAVVYDAADEVCLGGGRVARAERPAALPVV